MGSGRKERLEGMRKKMVVQKRACKKRMKNWVRKSCVKTAVSSTPTLQQLPPWPGLCSFIHCLYETQWRREREIDMNGTDWCLCEWRPLKLSTALIYKQQNREKGQTKAYSKGQFEWTQNTKFSCTQCAQTCAGLVIWFIFQVQSCRIKIWNS